RRWIVDLVRKNRTPQRVGADLVRQQDRAEIPAAKRICGDRQRGGQNVLSDPILFPIPEEKRFVVAIINFGNQYGSANGEAVVVSPLSGDNQLPLAVIRKRLSGIHELIDEVFISRSMELIRARLEGDVHDGITGLSELR